MKANFGDIESAAKQRDQDREELEKNLLAQKSKTKEEEERKMYVTCVPTHNILLTTCIQRVHIKFERVFVHCVQGVAQAGVQRLVVGGRST